MRCLVVSDQPYFTHYVYSIFEEKHEVSAVCFGEVIAKISLNQPELVILDLNDDSKLLPFLFQIQKIEHFNPVRPSPLLIGIAPQKISQECQVRYYNSGFDLVFEMPIKRELLQARTIALCRRLGVGRNLIVSPHLMFNISTRDIFIKTEHGELLSRKRVPPAQGIILQCLLPFPRQVWSKKALGEALEENNLHHSDEYMIDSIIKRLRKLLITQIKTLAPENWVISRGYQQPFIHNDYGIGYYFLDCLSLVRASEVSVGLNPVWKQPTTGVFQKQMGDLLPFTVPIDTGSLAAHEAL